MRISKLQAPVELLVMGAFLMTMAPRTALAQDAPEVAERGTPALQESVNTRSSDPPPQQDTKGVSKGDAPTKAVDSDAKPANIATDVARPTTGPVKVDSNTITTDPANRSLVN